MPFESPDLGRLLFQIGTTLTAQRQQQEQIDLKKREFEENLKMRAEQLKMQEQTLKMREEQFRISTEQGNRQLDLSEKRFGLDVQREDRLGRSGEIQDELNLAKLQQLREGGGGLDLGGRLDLLNKLERTGEGRAEAGKIRQFQEMVNGADDSVKAVLQSAGNPKGVISLRRAKEAQLNEPIVAIDDAAKQRIMDEIRTIDEFIAREPTLYMESNSEEIIGALPEELGQAYRALSGSTEMKEVKQVREQLRIRSASVESGLKDFSTGEPAQLIKLYRDIAAPGGKINVNAAHILSLELMSRGLTQEQILSITDKLHLPIEEQ